MRHLIAITLLALTAQAQADTTLSAVGVLSKNLGYEDQGLGLQLDHDAGTQVMVRVGWRF